MPRTAVLRDQKRINVSIEDALHKAIKARVRDLRLLGGLSEYIARLCVADLQRKNSIAPDHSRHLPQRKSKEGCHV